MKKLLVFIVFFVGVLVQAQSPEVLFLKGNKWYQEGEYSRAIEVYKEIESKNIESADLYFNLGNCYYKMNKVAPSIYYFEKALKVDPTHKDAAFNLAFAKRMSIDAIEELPKTFLQKLSESVIQKLPFDSWAIIAVIASFLVALLFLMYYFSGSSKKKLFYFNMALFSFVILVVTVVFAYSSYDIAQKNRPAIIFAEKTEVKNAPSMKSEDAFELHEGTKVQILDELDGWKKIKITDGKIGWIYEKDLREI
jgi:tetratricopeptide (TPR) repeat protein